MLKKGDNSFGVASVVFGILSLVFALGVLFGSFGGMALALLGIIFGLIQRKRNKNKWSNWGIILSSIGIVLNTIFFILLVKMLSSLLNQAAPLTQGSLV